MYSKRNLNVVICTLFEGNYHYGLAALTNSLYNNGYHGDIYAGFQGDLPKWASSVKPNLSLNWPGATTLTIADGLNLHFLPLEVDFHLTNYKPQFMLRLLQGPASDADGIAYFDPDIVVKCNWQVFEDWMTYGVALVHELVMHDFPPSHPLRKQWENVIAKANRTVTRQLHHYINAGFCGILKENYEFIRTWADILVVAVNEFEFDNVKFFPLDRTYLFHAGDQDALNIAAMCCECPISEMGPDGMDFIPGVYLMSHALGKPKPWKKNYLWSILQGCPPSLADKWFWANVKGPVVTFSGFKTGLTFLTIKIASFLGRFYVKH